MLVRLWSLGKFVSLFLVLALNTTYTFQSKFGAVLRIRKTTEMSMERTYKTTRQQYVFGLSETSFVPLGPC